VNAAGFKGGADDEGVAGGGERPGEEPLGLAGRDAKKILQRGAAGDGEGGELVLCQKFARAVNALRALGVGDRNGFVGAVFECGNGGWEVLRGRRKLGAQVRRVEGEDGRGGGGGREESSAGKHEEIVGCRERLQRKTRAQQMTNQSTTIVEPGTSVVTVEEYVAARASLGLAEVFGAIAAAARQIERKIRLAGLGDIYGAADAVNVQGEQQQKLDVFANELLKKLLRGVPRVAAIVSEEDEVAVVFERGMGVPLSDAEFVVVFDPLDGSSNIDVNVNVGTIFSVVRHVGEVVSSVLKLGTEQVAAGYVLYGPSAVMVMTLGEGVAAFTLDEEERFVLTAEGMTMPMQGPYYSANQANAASWPAFYREYLDSLVRGELGAREYGARYIGSLVADFHRTLLKGGVFLYPPTDKAPRGKLRLLYEAYPLAMIAEQAGGAAVDGEMRILEVQAEGIHDRTPLVIGSRREVQAFQEAVLKTAKEVE
jgi:fructose-1,6-bisphosphatase I